MVTLKAKVTGLSATTMNGQKGEQLDYVRISASLTDKNGIQVGADFTVPAEQAADFKPHDVLNVEITKAGK